MKKRNFLKTPIALLLIAAMLFALGCASVEKPTETPEPTAAPTQAPTQAPTEAPTQAPTPRPDPIANGDGTFDLDRFAVDLSGYPDPEPATVFESKVGEYFPEKNEILINVYPDYSENTYSFRFSDMPPYDEAKETEYGLGGYRISFTGMHSEWLVEMRHSRTVTDENDCAYILKNTLKQSFVPFARDDEEDEDIYPWLIIYFDSDYDSEQLCIDLDGYIYHTRSLKDVDRNSYYFEYSTSDIEYDYVSKEPIDLETNMRLMAMSCHYAWYLESSSNPVSWGYYRGIEAEGGKYEEVMDLMIEYNGETVYVTEPDKMIELTVLLDKAAGVDVKRETVYSDNSFLFRYCTEYLTEDDGLVKFTLYKKDLNETDLNNTNSYVSFCLTEDGRIVARLRGFDPTWLMRRGSTGEIAKLWILANANMVSEVTFPIDTIIEFIETCK